MDNMKFEQGGGRNSQHFVCSAAKIVGILNSVNQPRVKAFTLAEVLITLVIIGVVAALTIPSVVTSYKKHQTVTQLKKTYSAVAQTTNKAISDYGVITTWDIESGKTKEFVDKYMAPYLNVAKNCDYGISGDCEFTRANLNTPGTQNTFSANFYKLILNDGSALIMKAQVNNENSKYVYVYIDTNGRKGPNVIGKDIFTYAYWIKSNNSSIGKFAPDGGLNNTREYYKSQRCNKNETGSHCAALIMADGWQIKDDYPW